MAASATARGKTARGKMMPTRDTGQAASKAAGQSGNGKGRRRRGAGVVAAAALVFTLLFVGALVHGPVAAESTTPGVSAGWVVPVWDDDVQRWCSATPGVFACATPVWDDDVQRWCSETPGVFACSVALSGVWQANGARAGRAIAIVTP